MKDKEYMKTKEVATVLGVTPRRVLALCYNDELKGAEKEGKGWKIPKESVYAYLNNHSTANSRHVRPCAVGSSSYIDVVENSYYVDKTLLIRDLIDDRSPVILFTRPRRFGKTLALDMLQTYFERKNADVYFKDKHIWKCGAKYRKMQGNYPVIAITFKDVKYLCWDDAYFAIKEILRDEFMRHEELFASDALNSMEKNYLQCLKSNTLNDVEYARALLVLSRMLNKHHQKKVIILIDEYDTPIQQGFMRGYYEDIITFMRNLLSGGLKDSPYLKFSVLTGILRISKENLFSGLNNLVVNTVLDEKYSEYFGFTLAEVEEMASYYRKTDKLDEIRKWYDGYYFGNVEIFNPWSVANYFYNNCSPKPYWLNTSDNAIIREIMKSFTTEMAQDLLRLLRADVVCASLNMDVIYPQITEGVDNIYSFLLLSGYLKTVGGATETETGTLAKLKLPNMEVRRVYNTEILFWLKSTLSEESVMSKLEKSLYLTDAKGLQESIRQYMVICCSCFDTSAEGFYHGMMLGLVASMSTKYYIRSNRESGAGRFDLSLEPKEDKLPGIIMEFKHVKNISQLPSMAEEALEQIDEKGYDTEMKERGIKNIAKYGIAFCGKNIEICHRM